MTAADGAGRMTGEGGVDLMERRMETEDLLHPATHPRREVRRVDQEIRSSL